MKPDSKLVEQLVEIITREVLVAMAEEEQHEDGAAKRAHHALNVL